MTETVSDFMSAILVEPEQDTPRMIYADWLEEQGEGERAEFIRVQCRIAEIRESCGCGDCVRLRGGGQHHNGPCAVDKERTENSDGASQNAMLRQHERELWNNNNAGFNWFMKHNPFLSTASLHPCNKGLKMQCVGIIRRGFVSEIHCRLEDWMGEPCRKCTKTNADGFGVYTRIDPKNCECGGKYRIPGHGPAIVRSQPVERVVFSNKRPQQYKDEWWWQCGDTGETFLPSILFQLITPNPNGVTIFSTEQDAIDALSAAAILWAKEQPDAATS